VPKRVNNMDFREIFPLFSQINLDWFRVDTWFIVVMIIVLTAFIAVSITWGILAHHRPVSAGREDLIGSTAVVDTALAPKGLVFVEGERWGAILDKGRAEPEDEVIITKVEGLKLWVTKRETS
jgi:membrane-bound ClpP family serine protease